MLMLVMMYDIEALRMMTKNMTLGRDIPLSIKGPNVQAKSWLVN